MRYQLENERLKIEIDSLGAELKGVYGKQNDTSYLWYGDAAYWGRTSPVLFPFVGGLRNGAYTYQGKTYPMKQHGFARDMEFSLLSDSESELWFQLDSTPETLEVYPFSFVLKIGYRLKGNALEVLWRVENPSNETMYFAIGAHPAFLCPLHGEADKTGYQLSFGGCSAIHHYGNSSETGLALREDLVLTLEEGKAVLTPDFFDRCTYMIDQKQTGEVSLIDPQGRNYITMSFDAPLFALWSPEGKNAPFVCIEPWYGRCDREDFEGSLENREHENCLQAHESFSTSYCMQFA